MRHRLIPVLLVDRDLRLVKTVGFDQRTYVGDPFNVIRLFNEKEVDEICVLQIDATVDQRGPDLGFLRELSSECFMPMAYGGGIASLAHCEQLNRLGVEKFVLGTSALDYGFVREVARHFGSQAVTACIDTVDCGGGRECRVRSGGSVVEHGVRDHVLALEKAGVGEILLQSVSRDGSRTGMDLKCIREITDMVGVPVVALGGAGERRHLVEALRAGASAVASGSAFSFIGRLRAVLITYPGEDEIEAISAEAGT